MLLVSLSFTHSPLYKLSFPGHAKGAACDTWVCLAGQILNPSNQEAFPLQLPPLALGEREGPSKPCSHPIQGSHYLHIRSS